MTTETPYIQCKSQLANRKKIKINEIVGSISIRLQLTPRPKDSVESKKSNALSTSWC